MTGSVGRFERLQDLFHQIENLSPEAREQRLAEIRRQDPSLADELTALFAESVERLDHEVERVAARELRSSRHGEAFGPFVTRQLLGEGGMGEVFEATQEEPIRRRVALKVIRRGLESSSARNRFLAERQALAALDHPNIAKVYEAGSTEDRVPWFAMELIDGTDIRSFCDQEKLTICERIRLFLPVCRALHHAHRRGLLHRDLKPSNLLVVNDPQEGPTPKVIDFGIAKSLVPAPDADGLTRTGSILGTPDYMSPEQAEGKIDDLDTRSDLYSLGLVLFELLTGDLPISRDERSRLSSEELSHRLRSGSPPRPSRRLRSLLETEGGDRLAKARDTDSESLIRQLSGDLDWVLGRALAYDREERYESPEALAADLERFLAGEPVEAGPPTLSRRLRTVFFRHRTAVIVLSSAGLALLLGIVVSLSLFFQAQRNAARAERERATAEQTAEFLETLFRQADPLQHGGEEVSVLDLVEAGTESLDEELRDQPEVHARMLLVLGDVFASMSQYDRAESLLRRVLEEHDNEAVSPRLVVQATSRLAAVYRERAQPAEAEAFYRRALQRAREVGMPELEIGKILNDLGIVLRRQERFDEALPILEEGLLIARRSSEDPQRDPVIGSALNNLAAAEGISGNYEGARERLAEALTIFNAVLPPDHPSLSTLNSNISFFEQNLGQLSSARDHAEKAIDIAKDTLPQDHPGIADTLFQLSVVWQYLGDYGAAASGFTEAVGMYQRKFGQESFRQANPLQGLAVTALAVGDFEQGEKAFRRSLEILDSSEHAATAFRYRISLRGLATTLRFLGRLEEAEALARQGLALAEQAFADPEISARSRKRAENDRALSFLQLAQIELERGREGSARELYTQAADSCSKGCSLDSPRTTVYRAAYLARAGEREAALEALERSLAAKSLCAWGFDNPDLEDLEGPELTALRERFLEVAGR